MTYPVDNYFMGQGRVYAALRDTTAVPLGFRFLGNAPKVTLNLGQHAVQYATGGTQAPRNKHASAQPPTIDIDLESLNKENLAISLYGTPSTIAGASVSGEQTKLYAGQYTPLTNINLQSIASVTNVGATITYVNGVDYVPNLPMGTLQSLIGGAIADGQIVMVNYTFQSHDKVGGFTTAPGVYWIRFEGINLIKNNSPVVVDVFKVRIKPIDGFGLLGDNIVALALRGRILRDYTQPTLTTEGGLIRIRQL